MAAGRRHEPHAYARRTRPRRSRGHPRARAARRRRRYAARARHRGRADPRIRAGRGHRRLAGRLAGAAFRCRPHGDRFRGARARALRRRDRAQAAVASRLLWLRPRRGARRVRQRHRDAGRGGGHRHRGGAALAEPGAGCGPDGGRHRDRGARRQPRRRVGAVARHRLAQHARRVPARARRPAGLAGRGGGRRRDHGHRVDADRSDPVDRRRAADPALDVAAPEAVDRRADGGRAHASRLRGHRPLARGAARRQRRARPPHLEHDGGGHRTVGARLARARRRLARRCSRRRSGCWPRNTGFATPRCSRRGPSRPRRARMRASSRSCRPRTTTIRRTCIDP